MMAVCLLMCKTLPVDHCSTCSKGLYTPCHHYTPRHDSHPLILSTFQQPLRDFVFLYNVDMCAPSRQCVSIHSIEESLGYGFKQIFWGLQSSNAVSPNFQAPGSWSSAIPNLAPTVPHTFQRADHWPYPRQ